ncbi:RND family efflux transporter MFP subunit [mine drainage metagenome]|uniref:RND family efflux transporter MFP subunit n=1 Tax=mine drainage metagenome TaxID=410659 RepID=T1APE0_9ZZZZ
MSVSAGGILSASGYVVAQQNSTISSMLTSMVEQVRVTTGDHVHKGQLVAVLNDSLQRVSLSQQQSQLAMDRARVSEAGAMLVQSRLAFWRQSELARENLTSQASLDQTQATFDSDVAALKAAHAQVMMDQAAVQSAKIQLAETRIYAPFSGVVTHVYAHAGEMISPAAVGGFTKTGICDVVDMHSLEVSVDLNEEYLMRIHVGMPASVVLSAYPAVRFAAHVLKVIPVVNKTQATVGIRVGFDRLDPRILPGMQAQVLFYPAGVRRPTLIRIPTQAVHRNTNGKDFVYLIENGRLKRKFVRVQMLPGGADTVVSGLAGGARIVLSPQAPLRPGLRVRVLNPSFAIRGG